MGTEPLSKLRHSLNACTLVQQRRTGRWRQECSCLPCTRLRRLVHVDSDLFGVLDLPGHILVYVQLLQIRCSQLLATLTLLRLILEPAKVTAFGSVSLHIKRPGQLFPKRRCCFKLQGWVSP